jgi:hypothetical protein
MREYLLCLAAAAAVTYLLTPSARALAIRFGAMADVRDRDVHIFPTPRCGLAMLVTWGRNLGKPIALMSTIVDDDLCIDHRLLNHRCARRT